MENKGSEPPAPNTLGDLVRCWIEWDLQRLRRNHYVRQRTWPMTGQRW